jgi:hypothetical protein
LAVVDDALAVVSAGLLGFGEFQLILNCAAISIMSTRIKAAIRAGSDGGKRLSRNVG